MPQPWQETIGLKVHISRDGDFVSLGNRSEYPFVAGGSGYPAGWTMYNSEGTSPSDVNWTTQNGRFSVSNNSTVYFHSGKFYGVYRDFPVTPGRYYIFTLQARQMDGKTTTQRNIRYEWSTGSGSGSYGTAMTDWEQISIPTGAAPAGATYLRIIIQAVYYYAQGPGTDPEGQLNWGVQFQNVSIIDQDATYPEPTWEEVTCEVKSMGLRYGRDRFVNRYDVGSMTLGVKNDSGQFTYNPYNTLRPGRFIKVEAWELRNPSQVYDQFYGIIDSLTDSFTLDGHAITVIQAVDISSLLSGQQVPTATWTTSTYLSGARFLKLLDAVAWHPSMRRADPGQFIQQPIIANGRSVRDELGLIADSEGGYFFADRDGVLVYRDRNWAAAGNTAVNAELMAQPVELTVPMEPTTKFSFNGTAGNYMQVPSHTSFNPVNGGIDIQVRCKINGQPPTTQYLVKRDDSPGGPASWGFYLGSGKTLRFFLADFGGTRTCTVPLPTEFGVRGWVRVTRTDVDGVVRFWYAPDSDSAPTITQWVQLGDDIPGAAGAMVQNTASVRIGASSATTYPLNGDIWSVRIRDGSPTLSTTRLLVSTAWTVNMAGATSFPIGTPATTVSVFQVAPWQVIAPDPTPGTPQLPIVDDVPNGFVPQFMPIICLRELQTTWSRDRVVNEVSLANQGGSSITTIDTASQRKYGPRTYQRMDLLNVNDHPEYLTTRTDDIMDGYTDAILRVNSVQFRPTQDTNVNWFSLSVWLNWLVRVRYTHPTEGWGFSVASHVQGIEHSWGLQDWTVTLYLDNPEAFNFWNEALTAGWDYSEWDTNLWDSARKDDVFWSSGQNWSEGHKWRN